MRSYGWISHPRKMIAQANCPTASAFEWNRMAKLMSNGFQRVGKSPFRRRQIQLAFEMDRFAPGRDRRIPVVLCEKISPAVRHRESQTDRCAFSGGGSA